MPLILVQNEITAGGKYDHWQDNTGVLYHFPNQYINKIQEGSWFIYYRGARRLNNKRAVPEYFGFGKIGRVYPDPETNFKLAKKNLRWYCEIAEYLPFLRPVPFRIKDELFEKISDNLWSVAVRNISDYTFQAILNAASIEFAGSEPLITNSSPVIPSIDDVSPFIVSEQDQIFFLRTSSENKGARSNDSATKSGRYTKYSKLYGDHSEEVVYNMLQESKYQQLRWTARDKEKPGWDIEYYDNDNLTAVEVKATSGKRFLSVDITSNEWKAAKDKGSNYNLYLVADCLSTKPKIQIINDPYLLYLEKKISVDPLLYRLTMINGN